MSISKKFEFSGFMATMHIRDLVDYRIAQSTGLCSLMKLTWDPFYSLIKVCGLIRNRTDQDLV